MTAHPLPVTVISGLPGTGKRALLDHLMASAGERRVALVQMTDDMPRAELIRLAEANQTDVIVIDAATTTEPMSIAESLLEDEDGQTLEDFVTIDTMVTIVEAASFFDELARADGLHERGLAGDEDDRTLGELLIEQVEFCDVLVIDSPETLDPTALERLRAVLSKINPRAEQVVAQPAHVEADTLLDTGRFDFEGAASAPGWLSALDHHDSGFTESTVSGAGVFVYRARRPFHPARFFALLHQEWPGIVRSKGLFWLATRNDMAGTVSQVGGSCRHGPAGFWWVAQPAEEWPDDEAFKAEIAHDWFSSLDSHGHETVGDRRQELVMIGLDIDRDAWQHKLDACLLSEAEFASGQQAWKLFEDPFPQWDEDHDHEHGGKDDDSHGHGDHHDHPH